MAVIRWLFISLQRQWRRSVGALIVLWATIFFLRSTWVLQDVHITEQSSPIIPKKIWQVWIHPSKQPSGDWNQSSQTWTELNPSWNHQLLVMNNSSAQAYVQQAFKHRPDIVDAFTRTTQPIRQADLLRYLLLLDEGGVYSDLDTRCAKPIQDWIPPRHRGNIGLVIGIEMNDYFSWHQDPDRPYVQLCQWTIMSRPHHPTMEKVVQGVIARLVNWDEEDVQDITGPRAFTEAIFESLSELSGRMNEELRDDVSDLTEPYQIADVLILPINAFGSGQLHSGSKKSDDCDPLAVHSFAGSWRPKKPT